MSSLYLTTAFQNGKTRLTDSYFTQPFKVAKPFERGDMAEIMVMTATAGIMEGDKYDMNIKAGTHTKNMLTNQSFTKIFNTKDGEASQTISIQVEGDGELIWMMQPLIPFQNSAFITKTEVTVSRKAAFCYVDILACGRVGMKEQFAFRKYHGRMLVKDETGKPVFLDNIRMYPEEQNCGGLGYFEGATHIGSIYLYGYEPPVLQEMTGVEAVITETKSGYVVRMSGNSGDRLYQYAKNLYQSLIRVEV